MTIGTIRSRLLEEDEHEVERATDLIAAASYRVIEHLQLAPALSRQGDGGETESPRGHG
jgi:hypothetical protein